MSADFLSSSDNDRSAKPLPYAQVVTFSEGLELQLGGRLDEATVCYETYGKLNLGADNAVLICHALSGDSHVARHEEGDDPGWWETIVGPGKPVDTDSSSEVAKIENDVSFKVDKPVNEIKFLINKDIKIRKIGQKGKSLSYKLEKQFDISEYTDESDSSLQEEYKNAAELQIVLPNSQTEGLITLYYSLVATDEVDRAAFSREYIAYKYLPYLP